MIEFQMETRPCRVVKESAADAALFKKQVDWEPRKDVTQPGDWAVERQMKFRPG